MLAARAAQAYFVAQKLAQQSPPFLAELRADARLIDLLAASLTEPGEQVRPRRETDAVFRRLIDIDVCKSLQLCLSQCTSLRRDAARLLWRLLTPADGSGGSVALPVALVDALTSSRILAVVDAQLAALAAEPVSARRAACV